MCLTEVTVQKEGRREGVRRYTTREGYEYIPYQKECK
jgi:hypothetical protein